MTAPGYNSNVREYKTVRLWRTPAGFGFSLTGQYPCVLTHVVENSPAYKAGLKVGDYLIMVNGLNVVKYTHDAVVSMVASCSEYVILQVAQRTVVPTAGVKCTCSLNCQSLPHQQYGAPAGSKISGYPAQAIQLPVVNQQPYGGNHFDRCGVVYVGFLKLPLPSNATPATFAHLLSCSLNHFLLNKNLILMQPLILTANRQAICLTDNKNTGYNFILNSVAFVGTIPESPTNMFGLVLHCPPNPICVCHIFSTSLTRQQEQYLRLKPQTFHTAPDLVRYINYLISSLARTQPLCDSLNYNPNIQTHHNARRYRNPQKPGNFEAEIFVDNFQFPAGGVYTVSERNALGKNVEEPIHPRPRPYPGGKPPKCGCTISRVTSNASSASSATNNHDHSGNNNGSGRTFDIREAAMALARSRSLSRYYRKGFRGGSSRSSGSDDGRFGRGSSGGSGSFRVRYGSQRHKHHRSDRHRRRQDSASGTSGSARFGISDETTTTTSTTTFDSSVAANSSRRHYGMWQSGSSSLHRSRSIDSLINASKEEPQTSGSKAQPRQRGDAFLGMQQQIIIDGPYMQVDTTRYDSQHPTVSTDASGGLALNSLLSPRYVSFGTNASETDYDEANVISSYDSVSAARANMASQNMKRSVSGCQQQSRGLLVPKQSSDNKPSEMCEARSSTASVETRTEVAGSTLSLPMSSASAVTCRNSADGQIITFESLLIDKVGVDCFRKFLKTQVSDENLEFLLACDNFRLLTVHEELVAEARSIYNQFVSQHSKQPVNLTWQIVASIRRALIAGSVRNVSPTAQLEQKAIAAEDAMQSKEVACDMFDAAREHVYRLLKKDCYPRFVQSDFYRDLIGESKSVTTTVDSGASTASTAGSSVGLKSSGLRMSSRSKKSKTTSTDSGGSSLSVATSGSSSWNPAKLLSHIIGKAKNKPSRQKNNAANALASPSFRITFPDGSVETVPIDEMKTQFVASLYDCLAPLCASRGMSVFLCVIYQHGSEQPIDGQLSAASFSGRDLIIEQQTSFVAFYFYGSTAKCRRLLVRAKPCRRIVDVLRSRDADEIVLKEVWCIETRPASPASDSSAQAITLTKVNISSSFEGLVKDVQNHFVIAIAANRTENVDCSAICNSVKLHFETTPLPKYEDILNAVTCNHSWPMFDQFGCINLMKAISSHWRKLKQALVVGDSRSISPTDSKDDTTEYLLEGDVMVDVISVEGGHSSPEVVVNEPRSRKPIMAANDAVGHESGSKPTFQCRLVRGAHPLGEILTEQCHGRGTPSSIDSSFTAERIIGVNNMNYEVLDANGNIRQSAGHVSRFVRMGSAGDVRESPTYENHNAFHLLQNSLGGDENSCLLSSDEVNAFLGNNFHASPYARRQPRQAPTTKISVAVNEECGPGVRSSTPSPSTHKLIVNPGETFPHFRPSSNGLPTESTL